MFNKAAAKINVDTSENGVNVTSEKELSSEKKEQLKRKVLYGNFIKVCNYCRYSVSVYKIMID